LEIEDIRAKRKGGRDDKRGEVRCEGGGGGGEGIKNVGMEYSCDERSKYVHKFTLGKV